MTIPPAEWVVLATAAANRDPEQYPEPDRLDLDREAGGHLAFGHGIHYCLGAALARMEAEVVFGPLPARFPDLSLAVPAQELRWRRTSLMHGLEALPVRVDAG